MNEYERELLVERVEDFHKVVNALVEKDEILVKGYVIALAKYKEQKGFIHGFAVGICSGVGIAILVTLIGGA